MLFFLLGLQAATLPDISLDAVVTARSLTIQKHGEARLEVHADPDAGSLVKVEAPRANGTKTLHNVRIDVAAEARLGKSVDATATVAEVPR